MIANSDEHLAGIPQAAGIGRPEENPADFDHQHQMPHDATAPGFGRSAEERTVNTAGLARKPDQRRIAAGGPGCSCIGLEEIQKRTRSAGDYYMPGRVLDPHGKQALRVSTYAVESPFAVTLDAIAGDRHSRMAIKDIEQPVAAGQDANLFFEMNQTCHQQGLAVVGHCRETHVNLIAQDVACVMEPDRDQGTGRERDQNAHEERQLEHDRSPRSHAWSFRSGIGAGILRSVHVAGQWDDNVGNSVILRSVQP